MDCGRQCAFDVLNRCFQSRAWSALTIDSLSRKRNLSPRDTAFATYLVCGVLRNFRLLDYQIDAFTKKLDLPVRNALRLGAYQLLFSDRIPKSAAVNTSVDLVKENGFRSASGLVNAVLRKIDKTGLLEPPSIAIRYSHLDDLTEELIRLYGFDFTKALLIANNEEPELSSHPGITPGEEYIQDEAAYAAVRMLSLKSGERVLDLCAAPGGKSFTAAALMGNTGEVLSCDIHENKLSLVRENADRLGFSCITTKPMDASRFYPELEGGFDAVIADVPCSGFGVIRKKPEIRLRTLKETENLPTLQTAILKNALLYAKPGGRVLYSTCTILPRENGDVVRFVCPDRLRLERTFFPNTDHTDGFYAALLQNE